MAELNLFDEIGITGVPQFGGILQERYLTELQGAEGLAAMAKVMRREPSAYQVSYVVSVTASQSVWSVEPASSSPGDITVAQFVNSCLQDMSHSLWEAVRFALTAQNFGFADMEIVWKRRQGPFPKGDVPPSLFADNLIGVRKLSPRRQETIIKWEFDEHGAPVAMIQRDPATGNEIEPVPVEKLLHFIGGGGRGSWEGIGWLEPAYKLAYLIDQYEILYGVGMQRSFVGLPVFEYMQKPDAATRNNVQRMGRGLVLNEMQYVSYPGTVVKFRLESVNNQNAAELREKINQTRWELQGLALLSFLRLGTTGSGSRALAGPLIDLFKGGVNGALDDIAEVLNRYLVPRILRANPTLINLITGFPTVQHSEVKDISPDILRYLTSIQSYLSTANELDDVWLRNQLRMPPPMENDPNKQTMQEAQDAQHPTPDPAAADPNNPDTPPADSSGDTPPADGKQTDKQAADKPAKKTDKKTDKTSKQTPAA